MPKSLAIILLTLFIPLVIFSQEGTPLLRISDTLKLLTGSEVYPDPTCNKTLEAILAEENASGMWDADSLKGLSISPSCHWAWFTFWNPDLVAHTRVLYFPKGWQTLECYLALSDSTYEKIEIGIKKGREVLYLKMLPESRQELYVRYPEPSKAYRPALEVREMTEEEYFRLHSRTKIKYFLIGILIFPLLFFLVQFLVQRDKLSLYYLLFLLGASTHLLTILDTIPFFELCPKIVASMWVIKRLFVLSTLITLIGLIKYIHVFLAVSSWSRPLLRTGNLVLGIFLAIVMIPIIYPPVFQDENYVRYLPYFRVWALLTFVYVLLLCIWAVLRKVDFSLLLFLAFSPLVISGLIYASSFILVQGFLWLSLESLILITGFMLTLLLFGVVLGVRNNAIKGEKIRLEEQAEQFRELDQFKSRFYTNITHEFRTPLTVIKGMAGQIEENEKIKVLIQRNSDRLLNMVNQLLDLSRLETNSLAINWVQGDVIPYLQYLTESCHSLANNKKINLAFFSKEESLVMDYDETKLQHILINLLSNAIKFTPEYGSVKVTAAQAPDNGEPFLELAVSDTGKGITQEHLPHIFDRFYQAPPSPPKGGEPRNSSPLGGGWEGAGIGLALVRELVQLLEGRIEVESEENKGTTFVVMLPIRKEAPALPLQGAGQTARMGGQLAVANKPAPSSQPAPPSPLSPMRQSRFGDGAKGESTRTPIHKNTDTPIHKPLVLIVEDNADVTEYIISCLAKDYSLQTARNGREGVEKAQEIVPDVILCDVMMPEMDGFQACRLLKADRRTSHVPIVLLTAKATQEDKVAGLSQGADAYLTKPFDKEELLVRLKNLTAISQQLRERLSTPLPPEEQPSEQEQREAAFLQELHQIVESNMGDASFDTNRLCRAIAMSRTQLHRKLKALTGQATASYIRSIRLKKAKNLLETTDMPIGEIALQVGYKDFSHFSRSFAKEFGVSPSEARK